MNSQYVKDIQKSILQSDLGSGRELRPGEMGRRYDPPGGLKKHKARIDRDRKAAENLPFKFSKPSKPRPNNTAVACVSCGTIYMANRNTIGIICRNCNSFEKVVPVE
jgi:hypothetical protein